MLVICEGTHTEPNFLELMIEDFKEAGIIDFATTIKPKPTISPSDNTLDLNRGKEKRRKRLLKNTTQKQQEIENMDFFPGEQPLNWVKGVSSRTPEKSERENKSDVPFSDFSVNQIWSLRNLSSSSRFISCVVRIN